VLRYCLMGRLRLALSRRCTRRLAQPIRRQGVAALALAWLLPELAGACSRVDYVLGTSQQPGAGGRGVGAAGASGGQGRAASEAGATSPGPFEEPQVVAELSDSQVDDDDPTLTPDLLEIWFSSSRSGGLGGSDIWRSIRASTTDAWGEPTAVVELNSDAAETSVAVARSGLEIWITTNRPGGLGGFDVWVANRDDRDSPWSEPSPVPELNSAADDLARGTDRVGLRLMLASTRDTGGARYDLFWASRSDAASAWSTPVTISELNTDQNDADPFLAVDGRTLFFTSNRAGTAGDDLYTAVRTSPDEPFGSAMPLAELNGPGRDSDPWVSDDLRYMVYASEGDGEQLDLYEVHR
jgi:hypothetical protein